MQPAPPEGPDASMALLTRTLILFIPAYALCNHGLKREDLIGEAKVTWLPLAARDAGRPSPGEVGTALWKSLQTRAGCSEGVGQPPKLTWPFLPWSNLHCS